ncbi:UTRA domain-containing protein [Micromonospora sp. WMMD1082]|uniref:GntR family transcriptional regulator n=1 Tax=Micromonospora sp. WMMD1082 TaxID=3016104 RepID=UPI0024164EBD|nr:UTRA domain-containing protein [Micromonospora sp. WMMD1082]MDG4794883.1 UTRA domain-containing protein [Micromonospora sp. WMMD1082]
MSGTEWLSVSMPYVLPRPERQADAWAEEAARQGGVGTQRLLNVGEVMPTGQVAEALGVEDGEPVVARQRLMLLDDRPVELTDSYYPVSIARNTALAEPRKIRGGAVSLLADLGYRPGRVREDVYTRQPDAVERRLLDLVDREWVLGLTRVSSTEQGRPVEVSVMTMVPWGRRLRYELSID